MVALGCKVDVSPGDEIFVSPVQKDHTHAGTVVAVLPDGRRVFVRNGKGTINRTVLVVVEDVGERHIVARFRDGNVSL